MDGSEEPKRFRLLGPLTQIELIAEGRSVRPRQFLQRTYGGRRWRKMKGVALVEKHDGWIGKAEIHWFESHGIGKVQWKIKRELKP
jgi:hypothetical protein